MENLKPHQSLETIHKIISIIAKKERGAYLRFGDGEMNHISGGEDQYNRKSLNFDVEMKESICIDHPNYLLGVCLMSKNYGLLEDKMWLGNHEWPENRTKQFYNIIYNVRKKHLTDYYTFVAFNYYITTYPEKSFSLMKNIRDLCIQNNVIFIGNNNIKKDVISMLFGEKYSFIECPPKHSYGSIDSIENQLIDSLNSKKEKYNIVIFCLGAASEPLIKRIWKNENIHLNYFLFDYGSIIDALSGIKSRQYIICTKFNGIKYCSDFKNYIKNT